MNEDTRFREFEIVEGYEVCHSCGWKNIYDEELPQEGAPISGVYPVCPKCGKEWEFKKVVTKRTPMVKMTRAHFEKMMNHKGQKED